MKNKAKSLIELILSWILIFIIIGVFIARANILLIKAKERALKNELKNLRLAVSLYNMLNRRYPETLEALIDKPYKITPLRGDVLKGKFLSSLKYDEEGRLKDPFEKIYLYNPKTGVVKSQSKGYNDW